MPPKIPFNLAARKLAVGGQEDDSKRAAEALEHIADYLDRIESHLEKIAVQSSNLGKIETAISISLAGLAAGTKK